MKRTSILAALALALMFSQLGCGGPAVGHLKTIQLFATSNNLAGEGGTAQLTAIGNYSSNASKDLTIHVTYVVTPTGSDDTGAALSTPPNTMMVSSTGLLTAVPPFVCTWVSQTNGTTTSWYLSGSYQIVATFQGVTSQPIYISVASSAGNNSTGQCGPA